MSNQLYQYPIYSRLASQLSLSELAHLTSTTRHFQQLSKDGHIWRVWINTMAKTFPLTQLISRAIKHDCVQFVKLVLEPENNVHFDLDCAFKVVVQYNRSAIATLLLDCHPNYHFTNNWLVHLAISKSRTAIVKLLLDRGLDPNVGQPIKRAVDLRRTECVKLLIENGAQINDYFDLIDLAASSGDLDFVKVLIENPDITEHIDLSYGMYCACLWGHLDIMKLFIDRQPNLLQNLQWSRTVPGTISVNVAQFLIDHNAYINIERLLIEAVTNNNIALIDFLLQKSGKISTAFTTALYQGKIILATKICKWAFI